MEVAPAFYDKTKVLISESFEVNQNQKIYK